MIPKYKDYRLEIVKPYKKRIDGYYFRDKFYEHISDFCKKHNISEEVALLELENNDTCCLSTRFIYDNFRKETVHYTESDYQYYKGEHPGFAFEFLFQLAEFEGRHIKEVIAKYKSDKFSTYRKTTRQPIAAYWKKYNIDYTKHVIGNEKLFKDIK